MSQASIHACISYQNENLLIFKADSTVGLDKDDALWQTLISDFNQKMSFL